MARDLRDIGRPGEKEWQEFRSSFAAARLFAWLLDEIDEVAPGYIEDLRRRINEGISMGELLAEDDPTYDGAAIIHSPVRREATFIDREDALLLEDQLFPADSHDPRDFYQTARGLAVIALHSAVENYASSIGAAKARAPLPKAVNKYLAARKQLGALPSQVADDFTEFDETRHLLVHHRGVVTDRYVRNVKYTSLQEGELRTLTDSDLWRYSETGWLVAECLRTGNKPQSAV